MGKCTGAHHICQWSRRRYRGCQCQCYDTSWGFLAGRSTNVLSISSFQVSQYWHNSRNTPLRAFLQASMLSSEGDNTNGETVSSVTISTAHSAKGLEWPVVFVPGVEQGTFPFYRTESIEEERRLLYVACTRAQGLLYLSHASKRRFGAETKTKEISEFVSVVLKENPVNIYIIAYTCDAPHCWIVIKAVFTPTLPEFSPLDRLEISRVLDRKPCLEVDVTRLVNELWVSRRVRNAWFIQVYPFPLAAAIIDISALHKFGTTSTPTLRVYPRRWHPHGMPSKVSR